jgi:hypothetical protein
MNPRERVCDGMGMNDLAGDRDLLKALMRHGNKPLLSMKCREVFE